MLLAVVFLIAFAFFFTTGYFIVARDVGQELQKRPRGLVLGWLTTITIGPILGRARQLEIRVPLPKSLVFVRESLQAIMVLLFFLLCSLMGPISRIHQER